MLDDVVIAVMFWVLAAAREEDEIIPDCRG
jgi:hypothetical protein